jgi:hypothetical protein
MFRSLVALLGLVLVSDPQDGDIVVPANPLSGDAAAEDLGRFLAGVIEAEKLRVGLLRPDGRGITPAWTLGEAIVRFRDRSGPLLEGRPRLGRFEVDAGEVEARIRGVGRRIDPETSFGPFSGRWYGLWDADRVDHEWSRVAIHEPPGHHPRLGGLAILATQSAWVGDGFGWNVVAGPRGGGEVILGTVYHVEDGDRRRIRLHRPHVGVEAGPGRLIWITEGEVFLEELLDHPDSSLRRYAITGFRYRREGDRLVIPGEAFQALYTRDAGHRPAWYRFDVAGLGIGGEEG